MSQYIDMMYTINTLHYLYMAAEEINIGRHFKTIWSSAIGITRVNISKFEYDSNILQGTANQRKMVNISVINLNGSLLSYCMYINQSMDANKCRNSIYRSQWMQNKIHQDCVTISPSSTLSAPVDCGWPQSFEWLPL